MARLKRSVLVTWPTNGATPLVTSSGTWLVMAGRCACAVTATKNSADEGNIAASCRKIVSPDLFFMEFVSPSINSDLNHAVHEVVIGLRRNTALLALPAEGGSEF